MTRMYNALSPVSLSLDESPGRALLFSSGYDLRMSTYSSPDGHDLSENPRIRSMFQRAIGEQNLELKLNKLARDPKILAALAELDRDRNSGKRGEYESMDYFVNMKIDQIFQRARKLAWAKLLNDPKVLEIVNTQDQEKLRRRLKIINQRSIQPILNMQPK